MIRDEKEERSRVLEDRCVVGRTSKIFTFSHNEGTNFVSFLKNNKNPRIYLKNDNKKITKLGVDGETRIKQGGKRKKRYDT